MTSYLSQREERILDAVCRLHMLTNKQLTRLVYRGNGYTTVTAITKELTRWGYLVKTQLPHTGTGSGPLAYLLGRPGHNHLVSLGYDLPPYNKQAIDKLLKTSDLHKRHSLQAIDVMIAGILLGRSERVEMGGIMTERDFRVQKMSYEADGYLEWCIDGYQQRSALLELDRATEQRGPFMEKLRRLLYFLIGPYQGIFSTNSKTVLIVTPDNPERLSLLMRWVEVAIDAYDPKRELAGCFYLTDHDASCEPEHEFFGNPHWRQPFSDELVPYLSL
jgi:hypothetical protein